MAHQPCAIVGIGQTHHKSRRWDVSLGGLVREAATRALEDAQMDWPDIDAVVLGKAPDLFEGIMKPELYLTDALGAAGKPMFRVHTAGSVGGATGIVASHLIETGRHRRVLALGYQKQSEGNAQFALGSGKGASLGAGGAFAPYMRSYMYRSGAPADVGPMVAVKDRQNALKNPYAHLRLADISIDSVKASPMMWDPVRYLESCPSSDGACAVVFTDEAGGRDAAKAGRPPGLGARQRGALRALAVPGPRPGPAGGGAGLRHRRVRPGRHHRPAPADRLRRALRAVQLVRADVARGAPHRGRERGLEDGRVRRDRPRRVVPRQHVRRRAVVQPHRRLGAAALRRGRHAGARQRPASTRSTARRSPSPRPMVRPPSTSPCGSWPTSSIRSAPEPVHPWTDEAPTTRRGVDDGSHRDRRTADARPGHPLAAAALGRATSPTTRR